VIRSRCSSYFKLQANELGAFFVAPENDDAQSTVGVRGLDTSLRSYSTDDNAQIRACL